MNRVVGRLGIPQNKVLLEIQEGYDEAQVVEDIDNLKENFQPFILKPTHTSQGMGTWVVPTIDAFDKSKMLQKIKEDMSIRADPSESWTLRHLKPGVMVEELYVVPDFETGDHFFKPYELKIQTLWGRVLLGVMEGMPGGAWGIQYWIRRDGTSSCDRASPEAAQVKS